MNLHMPQDPESEAELRGLAAVPYQIISPGNNSAIMGIFQDSMLGSYLFTREGVKFTPREAMNLLMMLDTVNEKQLNEIIKENKKVSSFDLLSQIMLPLSMKYKTKAFNPEKSEKENYNHIIEIINGSFKRGQLDKSVLGGNTRGLLQRICNDFGNFASAKFIDDLQNIVTSYMKSVSFSVGVSDLIADKKINDEIAEVIVKRKNDVKNLIDQTQIGVFENNSGRSNRDEFELQVNNILNQATAESGKIGLKSLSKNNRFVTMVNAGSKGSDLNISFMISCLGQQNVDGKRIAYGFDGRTLPHFTKFDDSPAARGFVESSYINGLSPQELFMHAQGGREGLIDTAVKSVTWDTRVIIVENNKPIYTEIGRWIDSKLDNPGLKSTIQYHGPEQRNMELLNLEANEIIVPTTDEKGNISWQKVTAMTRHDPGTTLYEIKTKSGREVTVTESKSLLVWDSEKQGFFEILTPNIKIGDCVPVTVELADISHPIDFISLETYLPKTEYIYGTDYNLAMNMMNSKMENRQKIPSGWWNDNNGLAFVLPYTNKASLQRAAVRCKDNDNIEDGYIYHYHASRTSPIRFPERFLLNEENGIFIGLFLAEGNVHGSQVCITNLNENIKNFVKNWFASFNIAFKEIDEINKIGGRTNSIIASSKVLADFLTALVGHGAAHKYVPHVSFIANKSFVRGLLNGYFSGDGTISNSSIESGSASQKLTEGISFLCSRFGIFAKLFKTQTKTNNLGTKNILPSYRLAIRSQWGKKFAETIPLIDNVKQEKLLSISFTSVHRNYTEFNNVVLDPIVQITPMSTENNPKMYDLTIPTTLNFGLANGLQVRDTSSTGYIQRRLIKGLEDLMVSYDMTIRTNKSKIVQFSYGDDSIDTVKVENQPLPLVTMSVQEIYAHYNIPEDSDKSKTLSKVFIKNVLARYRNQKQKMMELNQKYTDYMIQMRGEIVENVFRFKGDSTVNCPVGFQYIVNNVQGQMNISSSSLVDITPVELYELLDACYENLEKIHFAPPTALFKVLFYFNLSPKELLVVKRFNKNAIMLLLETITVAYKRSLVSPGEMVGLLAGQSIGEVSTQLTLNSVTYDTEIAVRDENKIIKKIKIGDFVTWGIENHSKLEYMADKDTTYAEISKFYEVPCATEDGQTVWRRIEAVTKHPVVNEDGSNTLIKVTTKGCREVTATKAKSFLQLVDGKITDVAGADLQVGQYLPVSKKALDFAEVSHLNLRTFLPPSEYIYGTDFARARELSHEHHWWSKYAGKEFVLPYNRSDSCYEALNGSKRRERMDIYVSGCVYTKTNSICNYAIPEKIPLDYNFGYLVGAYCAEGCVTDHQVKIANNDLAYFGPIYEWCARYNINTKINRQEDKGQEGWVSQDLTIYSTLLTHVIEYLAGKLSHNKYIASEIMFSNRDCIMGFMDAYFGGDGCVQLDFKTKVPICISAHSVSFEMLMNVQVMLKNLGVLGKMQKVRMPTHNNRGTTVFQQPYKIEIRNQQASKFAAMLNMKLAAKQERANHLASHSFTLEYCKDDLVVPNLLSGQLYATMEPRNNRFVDIEFDEIVSIEEVPGNNYVFDLTVDETRNFDTIHGLAVRDTFHFAGVASKSNATRGVPRIEEILSVSTEPKNPSLTVYLKPEDESSKERAQSIMYMLEHTALEEIVESIGIYFDPDDLNSLIEQDRDTIEQYRYFENMVKECAEVSLEDMNKKSKWILRLEMDPEIMLEKNITMEDVSFTLHNAFGDDINCIYTDYNADKLIFRVRMNEIMKNGGMKGSKKKGAPLDQSDQIYILKNFQEQVLHNTVLRGIKNIGRVTMRKIKDNVVENNGVFVKKDIWVLDTVGTNMIDVMGLDFIDPYRTFSNDIVEVYETLGIEAARQAIYNEMVDVIEFDGTYINYHNFSVLIDRMTFTHKIISIFRHGINNDNTGPIAKASFEETPEMFLKAARHADLDTVRGISANIMCGQEGYFGTSAFQVVLDLEEMQKLHETSDYKDPEIKEIEHTDATQQCSIKNLAVQNNVVSIKQTDLGEDVDDYNPGF